MKFFLPQIALGLTAGIALLGCERPAGTPVSDTARAATADSSASDSDPATEKVADPIEDLNTKLESMGARVVAEPAEGGNATEAKDIEALAQEVAELRTEVKRLQETVDLTISYVVGDLQEENRRLREEVARAYGVTPETSEDGREVVVLNPDALPMPEGPTPEIPMPAETVDYGEAGYLVVKEWGRSPDEVKSLGADVPSLKGMICAVSPSLSDAELSALGRQLRSAFDAYDNIVIEAFTDEAAAMAYAENNVRSTTYNVLSVQKDGSSGKDYIVLNRNGVSIEVPR